MNYSILSYVQQILQNDKDKYEKKRRLLLNDWKLCPILSPQLFLFKTIVLNKLFIKKYIGNWKMSH